MGSTHRRQRGAAVLEMAIVALLLFALLFGIISYAYMMSFRQSLTQAAAEGARAGAVAPSADVVAAATNAVNRAMDGYDVQCGDTGMTCSPPVVADCLKADGTVDTTRECVTVTVEYAYRDNPILPSFPGLGLTLPEELTFTSTAEINP